MYDFQSRLLGLMLCLCVILCTADERAILGDANRPKLKIKKHDSRPRRQGTVPYYPV